MSILAAIFGILMFLTAVFLILLVLVQRGRGGGLSGALGGMGGQSAFGTKAGDLFTRVTIVAATFWLLLCIGAILVLNRQSAAQLGGGAEKPEFTSVGSAKKGGDADTSEPAADKKADQPAAGGEEADSSGAAAADAAGGTAAEAPADSDTTAPAGTANGKEAQQPPTEPPPAAADPDSKSKSK